MEVSKDTIDINESLCKIYKKLKILIKFKNHHTKQYFLNIMTIYHTVLIFWIYYENKNIFFVLYWYFPKQKICALIYPFSFGAKVNAFI